MEKYHEKIKKRMYYELILAIVLIPIASFTAITFFNMDAPVSGNSILEFLGGFINGIRSAIGAAFIAYLFIAFVRDKKAIKDENKLKELFIVEHDERMINISETSSKISFNVILYITIVAALVFGVFNTTVSLTLFSVWVFIVIVRIITTLIYNKKM